jgi:uncharacterized membrane protein YdbT with pleckstrin-like domain
MDLEPGEKIIFEGHPSWRSILDFYLKGLLVVALVGGAIAGATKIADDEVNTGLTIGGAIAAFAIVLVVGYVKRLFTVYVISDKRLYIRRGIVARREQQTHVNRVQNVNTHQSVTQRLLRIGDVDFDTAGQDDADFLFGGVADPREVVEAVHRAQREADAIPGARPPA